MTPAGAVHAAAPETRTRADSTTPGTEGGSSMHKTMVADARGVPHAIESEHSSLLARILIVAARGLFASIFVIAAPGHFQPETIEYAAYHGVPFANVLVPFSGVLSMVGALSVALGYRARLGAWMLVVFLVPVTLAMHNFWDVADPLEALGQQVMFLKNLSILGGALLVTQLGSGPASLDHR